MAKTTDRNLYFPLTPKTDLAGLLKTKISGQVARSIATTLAIATVFMGFAKNINANSVDSAKAIVAKLAEPNSDIEATVKELVALDPQPIEFYREYLARQHTSTPDERRTLLRSVGADVPDATGKFTQADVRLTKDQKIADENFDWLANIAKLAAKTTTRSSVFQEVVADVAVIRALAASKNSKAGGIIFDFAFSEAGIVYRDECGRYLRHMSPYSLPSLIVRSQSQAREDSDSRRYATYQLERLDRENPTKAVRDAADDRLKVEVLNAFAESRFREAIYAVLELVNDSSPSVRAAARAAWMKYLNSRPHSVPKRKLVLPGGKYSEEKTPLWYNHLELQDVAMRAELKEVTGRGARSGENLKQMSQRLFDYFDSQREDELNKEIDSALTKSKGGDMEEAVKDFDRVLAQSPNHPRRSELASGYMVYGDELAENEQWEKAAAAFGSAYSCATGKDEDLAQKALGKHHNARGQFALAHGSDAKVEFEKAQEADPISQGSEKPKSWMLYAGGIAVGLGLMLFIVGIVRRRKA